MASIAIKALRIIWVSLGRNQNYEWRTEYAILQEEKSFIS